MTFHRIILHRVTQLRQRHQFSGVEKIQKMLADPDYGLPVSIGRDRLAALMKQYNLQSKLHKRFKKTSDSNHALKVYPNLVKDVKVKRANAVWVSDITYLRLAEGKFCYLFLVSDLFSRKILGYAIKESLAAEGAEEALLAAIKYAKPQAGFIHHSDHGIQYCSKSYIRILQEHGALISMTGENHCYDNAIAERINGILKQEYGLGTIIASYYAATRLASNSILIYNSERLHASLGLKTPDSVYLSSIYNNEKSA